MRLTPIRRVPTGARLARDVDTGHPGGIPLLRAGVEFTERYREAVQAAGIHAVWIDDELSRGITPVEVLSPETRRKASAGVVKAVREAGKAIQKSQPLPPEALQELAAVADLIAKDVAHAPEMALALEDLAAGDTYTHRHSVNVCAVGLLVGRRLLRDFGWVDGRGERRFDRMEHRLRMLGLGLLLHDIGKLAIPTEVLNKPDRLDPAEWELMKNHPATGVALLPETASPLVKSIVRDHHERWDGSGYPRGISGDAINQLPRVAAVADVYDAVTSERVYAAAKPPHVAVCIIRDGADRAYDPEVVSAFREVVFPYPPGTEVTLPDGRLAVVSDVNPRTPDQPFVRVQRPEGGVEELRVDLVPGEGADLPAEADDRTPVGVPRAVLMDRAA